MRVQFVSPAVGTNLEAISLPAGEARGVVIDNPSGSWVQLFPTFDFVAPYTLGYARTLPYACASVSVRYQSAGPSEQVSTSAGDPIRVWLDTGAVGDSPGIVSGAPFVQQFTPIITVSDLVNFTTVGAFATPLIPAVVGKRVRIWSVEFSRAMPALGGDPVQSPVDVHLIDSATIVNYCRSTLTPETPARAFEYSQGLDLPENHGLDFDGVAAYADVIVGVVATYSLI